MSRPSPAARRARARYLQMAADRRDKAFRKPTGDRCCQLDQNGRRCRRAPFSDTHYHGGDLYSHFDDDPVTWVKVTLCWSHWRTVK